MVQGHLIVISAPSGTGKTTVIDRLLKHNPKLVRAVTCTTRAARPGEVDGHDYNFLTEEEFGAKVQANEFLEWATVHGNRYGTLRKTCMDLLDQGSDVVLNIDVQGALSVKKLYPQAVLVFLCPPSLDILEERLRGRGTNTDSDIAQRIQDAHFELSMKNRYDYEVVNDDLLDAVKRLEVLIAALPPQGKE
ncbi:MAG: guanylate kinase [Deltaproteobacteria bacterium CG11_big_fil_rev_8_21_14_0_20_47_16]|nr:MAG: guanylate kinase [Deltaproteobacteria bacterium CG11_big_fil_rev_8_21_14_0_20_47_16]